MKWIEFTSGPPLMEAMSTGSVDLGAVGDTPPIFAQAANANIVYVAGSPITNGQGILVPANSTFARIADLKGKRVGVRQGHQRAQRADRDAGKSRPDLRGHHAGLSVAAGCRAGFRQWQHRGLGDLGSVFCDRREAAERPDSRQRLRGRQDQFVLSSPTATSRTRMRRKPARSSTAWPRRRDGPRRTATSVAASLAAVTGVPLEIQTVAANRASFAIGPVTDDIIATQQARRRPLPQARPDSRSRSRFATSSGAHTADLIRSVQFNKENDHDALVTAS